MTKRDRLRQIHRWLLKNFPLHPKKVTLRIEKMPMDSYDGIRRLTFGASGIYYGDGWIVLEMRRDLATQIDTLLHEHAHIDVWHLRGRPDHPDEWGLSYARRYRSFYDEGGATESRSE